jgi:hypothetical protein
MRPLYKNMLQGLINILLLSFLAIVEAKSQSMSMSKSTSLGQRIEFAFDNVKKNESVYIDPQLEREVIDEFYRRISLLNSQRFNNNDKTNNLVQYYSTQEGMEKLLKDWIKKDSFNWDSVLNVKDSIVKMKPASSSSVMADGNGVRPLTWVRPKVPDKYATLIIRNEPQNLDVEIYLDNRFICTLKDAVYGLRIHSGEEYMFEMRLGDKVYCRTNITLNKQERRITKCNLN